MSTKVLVVDDNEDHRMLITRRLRNAGMVVSEAATASEALAAPDEHDVIVLDYRLPDADGLQALKQFMQRDPQPAVVMVTGMGSATVVVDAMRAGATDYVVKDTNYLNAITTIVERAWRAVSLERREAAQRHLEHELVTELQNALDLRQRLVAAVSHELRTPLTSIHGFATTLDVHWNRLGDEERKESIGRIRKNAAELSDLVDRLLDFAYIESGRMPVHIEAVDLPAAVHEAVNGLSELAIDRDLAVDCFEGSVKADAVLLRRALWNLLSNAAKYSDPGTPIEVVVRRTDGYARIEVHDHGDGVREGELARVFEPFWRSASQKAMSQRGTGLGLALVRDYARLMGGDVGAESEHGAGATFWFTVPVAD